MTNSEITALMERYVQTNGRQKVLSMLASEASKLSMAASTASWLLDSKERKHTFKKYETLQTLREAVSNLEVLEIALDLYPSDQYQEQLLRFMRT